MFLVSLASPSNAQVSANLYYADGNTPLEYSDIMVGTQLKIIISSQTSYSQYYNGTLKLLDTSKALIDADYGNAPTNSILPSAGTGAFLQPLYEGESLQFGAGDDPSNGPDVGDWFIIDYNAIDLGTSTIELYRNIPPPPYPIDELLDTIELNHVKTRDVVENYVVGFDDFALLAEYWQVTDCGGDPNCLMVDFDDSNSIDINDLMEFADYWLEKTQ